MSDLISRSELIKHFNTIQQQECAIGLDFVAIIDEIKEQPTAYFVDDVVEELETNKQNALEVEESIKEYNVWNKAIEIVKQGGVSDDACEWNLEDDNLMTGCGDYFNLYDNCTDKFKFCPTCGKKIKAVE